MTILAPSAYVWKDLVGHTELDEKSGANLSFKRATVKIFYK